MSWCRRQFPCCVPLRQVFRALSGRPCQWFVRRHVFQVVRRRQLDGVPCYEVRWQRLTCDVWTEEDFYVFAVDIEPFRQIYQPNLIASFEANKKAKTKSQKNEKATKGNACAKPNQQRTLDAFVKRSTGERPDVPDVLGVSALFEDLALNDKVAASDLPSERPILKAFSNHSSASGDTHACMDMLLQTSLMVDANVSNEVLPTPSPAHDLPQCPRDQSTAQSVENNDPVDEFTTPPSLRDRLLKHRCWVQMEHTYSLLRKSLLSHLECWQLPRFLWVWRSIDIETTFGWALFRSFLQLNSSWEHV